MYNVNPRIPHFKTKISAGIHGQKMDTSTVCWSNLLALNVQTESQNIYFNEWSQQKVRLEYNKDHKWKCHCDVFW